MIVPSPRPPRIPSYTPQTLTGAKTFLVYLFKQGMDYLYEVLERELAPERVDERLSR